MPFDFNNSPRKSVENNNKHNNKDYSSSGNMIPRSSMRNTPVQASSDSSAFSNRTEGFTQRPAIRNGSDSGGNIHPSTQYYDNDKQRNSGIRVPRRPRVQHRSGFDLGNIPWGAILLVVGIIAVVAFLWIYREVITAFLMQVFTWIIMILIMILLCKWLIFGGRRK